LVWIADRDSSLHGTLLDSTDLHINHPNTLHDADLDILVIGTRQDFIDEIIGTVTPILKSGGIIISTNGETSIQ